MLPAKAPCPLLLAQQSAGTPVCNTCTIHHQRRQFDHQRRNKRSRRSQIKYLADRRIQLPAFSETTRLIALPPPRTEIPATKPTDGSTDRPIARAHAKQESTLVSSVPTLYTSTYRGTRPKTTPAPFAPALFKMLIFGNLIYVSCLLINAIAILSEDRFLARSM